MKIFMPSGYQWGGGRWRGARQSRTEGESQAGVQSPAKGVLALRTGGSDV